MKILHINCTHYRLHFKNLVRFQRNHGCSSDVLYYTYLRKIDLRKITTDEEEYVFTIKSQNKYYLTRFFIIQRMKFVLKEILTCSIEYSKYDLYHAHKLFTDGYIANELFKKYSVGFIVTLRNTDLNKKFYWKLNPYKKVALEILFNSVKIIFISYSARDRFKSLVDPTFYKTISNKIEIIPNAIDSFWIENRFLRSLTDFKKFQILTVGDINKNKNILLIAKAINRIKKQGYNIKLYLVGRVKDKSYFKKIMNYNFVDFLGYLGKEELMKIMRKSNLFVLVSKSETFGLVYAESITQGLPVIYTKSQGFDGFFNDGFVGFAAEAHSSKKLCDTIINIMLKYEKIIYNINTMEVPFTEEKVNEKYFNIYRSYKN